MRREELLRKLTSRKLWMAIAGFVSGVILALGGDESRATAVAGIILQGASVLGYLLAEGLTDAAVTEYRSEDYTEMGEENDYDSQ